MYSEPYDQKNPYPSIIVDSRELFNSPNRNCIHMEFDINGSGITYLSGDHIAIWPINPEEEVYRLLKVLGLWEKKDTVVTVESTDRKYLYSFYFNLFYVIYYIYIFIYLLTEITFVC